MPDFSLSSVIIPDKLQRIFGEGSESALKYLDFIVNKIVLHLISWPGEVLFVCFCSRFP
jgi:hypothetical protein